MRNPCKKAVDMPRIIFLYLWLRIFEEITVVVYLLSKHLITASRIMNEIFTNFKEVVTKKYSDFNGRAGRKEYWLFQLAYLPIYIVLYTLWLLSFDKPGNSYIYFSILLLFFTIGLALPSISLTIRRLHDVGKGGGWIFIGAIPVIGELYLLYLMICKGRMLHEVPFSHI